MHRHISPKWGGETPLDVAITGQFRDREHLAWALRAIADRLMGTISQEDELDISASNMTMEYQVHFQQPVELIDAVSDHEREMAKDFKKLQKIKKQIAALGGTDG